MNKECFTFESIYQLISAITDILFPLPREDSIPCLFLYIPDFFSTKILYPIWLLEKFTQLYQITNVFQWNCLNLIPLLAFTSSSFLSLFYLFPTFTSGLLSIQEKKSSFFIIFFSEQDEIFSSHFDSWFKRTNCLKKTCEIAYV